MLYLVLNIIFAAVTFILLVWVVTLTVLLGKEKKKNRELSARLLRPQKTPVQGKPPQASVQGKPQQVTVAAQQTAPKASTIAIGIRKHAGSFAGLYESLYRVVKIPDNFTGEVFAEFYGRVEQLDDAVFKNAFAKRFPKEVINDDARCRTATENLLRFIAEAGIKRDAVRVIASADAAISQCYIDERGKRPVEGQRYRVINPAWRCGDKVVERGLLCIDRAM